MKTWITLAFCALAVGCQSVPTQPTLGPLRDEGEVYVYVRSADPAGGVSFSAKALAAMRGEGANVPLEPLADFDGGIPDQQLLAFGRVPPGEYGGLSVIVSRARLSTGGAGHDLAAPDAPITVPVPFGVAEGKAVVVALTLDASRSVSGMAFVPVISGRALSPVDAATALPAYCTNRGGASITAFDRRTGAVLAVLPTGAEPGGLALESMERRAFVPLSGEDQIQVLDLTSGLESARVPLQTGDRPRELVLSGDGRVLLAINEGSDSVSFVDTSTLTEFERITVGEQPWSIRLDRSGRRAFVLAARGSNLAVIDIAARAVIASAPTGPDPVYLELNRAGDRLYVVERGSPYVSVYSTATLALANRIFVGGGARSLLVDPFTDYVYVARDLPEIQVYDPFSLLELARIDVPGPVTSMAIDPLNKSLLAIMPSLRAIAVVSTVTRLTQRSITVGLDPFRIAFPGRAP